MASTAYVTRATDYSSEVMSGSSVDRRSSTVSSGGEQYPRLSNENIKSASAGSCSVTALQTPFMPGRDPESARQAARSNAAQTSVEEERAWLTERQILLKKQMVSGLDKAEKRRLEYIRWNLARIEDARIGPKLDQLEAAVKRYEDFLVEISRLRQDIDASMAAKRR